MKTRPMTLWRSARLALLALLSATVLAACGGGDYDADQLDATAATSQDGSAASPAVSLEHASAQASRSPMGGGRRVPICMLTPSDCQPNVPPTQ
jgi:hypothetical protein